MHKHKIKFLLCILLLAIKTISGQSLLPPGDGIQISFSTGNAQYKDKLLNGLRNNGLNLSFGVHYSINKHSLNHEVGLTIDLAPLWNRYGWGGVDNHYLQPNIYYRLLTNVKEKIQLGGIVNYATMFYRNEFLDSHHNYWRTKINLGFSVCYPIPIHEKWTLFIPLNLPVIGVISRPAEDRSLVLNEPDLKLYDILKRMHSNFQFVAIGYKYFEIETGIFFGVKLTSNRQLTFGYKILYEQTTTSLKSQLLTNQISVKYSFKK
ncbi:MAG: hypothetical protein FWD09_04405 [Lentimicrobiaceae bacterium]|nr:hypothetical protein [Lentimicrobiaceae bacterium]